MIDIDFQVWICDIELICYSHAMGSENWFIFDSIYPFLALH